MSIKTKVLFAIAMAALVAFCFLVSPVGQEILRGPIPMDATPFERDDIWMGAGLFPWVYALPVSLLLYIAAGISFLIDRRKASK